MRKRLRKHPWILGFIILSLLVFTTVLFAQRWVQVTQLVASDILHGVWMTATKNTTTPLEPTLKIYAVGESGRILFYDGNNWNSLSNAGDNLYAVWGSSEDDIFFVGNNGTIRYFSDETVWTNQTVGTEHLYAIWGTSATNVYAMGANGTILHTTNGTVWSAQTVGAQPLYALWGSSSTDIFAVGSGGTILHSANGTDWTAQTSGTTEPLYAVWGSSSSNVYAVGNSRTVLHYNGTTWAEVPEVETVMNSLDNLRGIWGTSPYNIYVVGEYSGDARIYRFNGSNWSRQDDNVTVNYLNAINGASLRDIFAVGEDGFVMKLDPEDSTAPAVISSQPGLYDSNIPLTTTVTATFNAVMDTSTLNSTNFTVVYYENQEAHQVAGTISFSNNNSTVTFTPSSDLAAAVTYTATLKAPDAGEGITGVTDNLGVPLAADYSWSFTPGSDNWDSGSSGGGCFIAVSQPAR